MENIIKRASELHSAPGVARSVLELVNDEDFVMEKLVSCIEVDPLLTARVLSTVNSARYALSVKISNLSYAIMLLGRKTLRDIALTFSVVDSFTQDLSDDIYADFWKRSLTTSCVASHLSQGVREVDSQDAYTVGLLTDLGILVLAQLESDRYLPLYRNNAHGPALIAAERNEFGFDHAQLAAGLLQAWNFPAVFAIAIASHHDEEMSAFTPLSRIVRAGNLMPAAIWIRDGDAYMEAYSWFQLHFDFDVDQFVGLAFEVNRAVAEAAKIYAVKNLAPVDPDALEEKSRTLMEAVGCGGVAG